jgi:hypothetical protein
LLDRPKSRLPHHGFESPCRRQLGLCHDILCANLSAIALLKKARKRDPSRNRATVRGQVYCYPKGRDACLAVRSGKAQAKPDKVLVLPFTAGCPRLKLSEIARTDQTNLPAQRISFDGIAVVCFAIVLKRGNRWASAGSRDGHATSTPSGSCPVGCKRSMGLRLTARTGTLPMRLDCHL